jgi:hypothetical protein
MSSQFRSATVPQVVILWDHFVAPSGFLFKTVLGFTADNWNVTISGGNGV